MAWIVAGLAALAGMVGLVAVLWSFAPTLGKIAAVALALLVVWLLIATLEQDDRV